MSTVAARADLRRLLRPRSIAVVGASDRPGSYGAQTLENLDAIGFPGPVWGVNPNRSEVGGRPCVADLSALPDAVDAVVVAVPAAAVPQVIEDAGALGCGGAVVYSAGFGEAEGGAELQRALIAAAERHGLPVCGPNCDGIVALTARSTLWGDAFTPQEPGTVALIAQSGNVAVNALAARRGLRFHTVVASGNQAVLSAADFLAFLAQEGEVTSVALYLEDDGGPSLCDALADCAARDIRVAVLKVGASESGARAAAAHSAALAGDQRVFRSLVEAAGAAWAHDVHELLELAKTGAVRTRSRVGAGLAIMTCSGGDSAQGADEAARLGLDLPPLGEPARARLARLLPSAATVANPLDYTALLWGERAELAEMVCALGEDPAIGQVLVFYDQPAALIGAVEESWRAVREGVVTGAERSPVPTMVCSTLPELLDDDAAWRFARAGIPAAAGLRTGLRCAAAMRAAPGDATRLREIADAARAAEPAKRARAVRWLGEHDAKTLLRAGGVEVIDGRVVGDAGDAAAALAELGGHVAMKVSSAGIQHKSELGAVVLGLRDEDAVRTAYLRLAEVARAYAGVVLVERMAPPGLELLVAAHVDAVAPALVIGLGGVWTEMLDDVAVVPLPCRAEQIERALSALRAAPMLAAARGGPPPDVGALFRLAERIGELLLERGLRVIECNPVVVWQHGAMALDAAIAEVADP